MAFLDVMLPARVTGESLRDRGGASELSAWPRNIRFAAACICGRRICELVRLPVRKLRLADRRATGIRGRTRCRSIGTLIASDKACFQNPTLSRKKCKTAPTSQLQRSDYSLLR